jgi:hypothetical protein
VEAAAVWAGAAKAVQRDGSAAVHAPGLTRGTFYDDICLFKAGSVLCSPHALKKTLYFHSGQFSDLKRNGGHTGAGIVF